jgi:hypothetical protein
MYIDHKKKITKLYTTTTYRPHIHKQLPFEILIQKSVFVVVVVVVVLNQIFALQNYDWLLNAPQK